MRYGGLEVKGSEANFVFYSADGQRFLEPAKKCTDCNATGQVDGEEAVVDYVSGGSLVEVVATCLECEGLGFVVDNSDDS